MRPQNRLRSARDFELIRKQPNKADCAAFVIYLTRAEDGRAFSRFGIVASRRTGNAVERNSLKRIFREIFRSALPDIKNPCDIAVFARRAALRFEFDNLAKRFRKAVEELSQK